jgi:hypothetical protein
MSIGNIHNNVRRAHRNGLALIGFLAIPKSQFLIQSHFQCLVMTPRTKATRQYADKPNFRKFRRQLFHSSLSAILQPLKPGMTKPEAIRCADGHFRRAIYGLGPYIADYPEQALLACIVQGWCPK